MPMHIYVAFSRVRTKQGLQILENKKQKNKQTNKKPDPKVTKEVDRLQKKTIQIPQSLTPTLQAADVF